MRVLVLAVLAAAASLAAAGERANIPYTDARPILEGLKAEFLPVELRGRAAAELEKIWPDWVTRRDAEIRTRVDRGGLPSDTSIYAAFAIDRTLSDLKLQGLLGTTAVRRVAIVGPGLDLIQPFALVDSLRRYDLAADAGLTVTTYDLSLPVNEHLATTLRNAQAGRAYALQLPRDTKQAWEPELVEYWERAGNWIGATATPVAAPAGLANVRMRAITIRPDVVRTIVPEDADIVLQRPDPLPNDGRFDLVIATNILIHYDVFEQSLALANISRMLAPEGLLLTNNPLFELPGIPMHAIGGTKVTYANGAGDGVVWYQRDRN